MSRCLIKSWSDRKPFTRRVRWYAKDFGKPWDHRDIRLCFEDSHGVANRLYEDNHAKAETDWERFRDGTTTATLRAGG